MKMISIIFAALFYLSVILGTVLVMCCMPLFLEITCETSYPIAEGVTTGFLGMVVNIGATVFMCIELIPHLGKFSRKGHLLLKNWFVLEKSDLRIYN